VDCLVVSSHARIVAEVEGKDKQGNQPPGSKGASEQGES